MTTITLPPLPEPDLIGGIVRGYRGAEDGYGLALVEQIRRDAVRAALGAAVKACADEACDAEDTESAEDYAYNSALEHAVKAIRALMPKDAAAERVAAAGGSGLPDLLAKFDGSGLPDVSGKATALMPKEEGK